MCIHQTVFRYLTRRKKSVCAFCKWLKWTNASFFCGNNAYRLSHWVIYQLLLPNFSCVVFLLFRSWSTHFMTWKNATVKRLGLTSKWSIDFLSLDYYYIFHVCASVCVSLNVDFQKVASWGIFTLFIFFDLKETYQMHSLHSCIWFA